MSANSAHASAAERLSARELIRTISRDAERLCIGGHATIREALRIIEEGLERICLVLDDTGRLRIVVTDGDIRRALLRGATLDDAVGTLHDRQPIVIRDDDTIEQARMRLSKRIMVAPVVDSTGMVRGLLRHQDVMPFLDIKSRDILVVGLGYVGLTLGLVLADNGFSVQGYDTDSGLLARLARKEAPFFEKGLQNYIDTHIGHTFRLVDHLDRNEADVYVITVGTPIIRETKKPNIAHIEKAVAAIGAVLKKHDLVILRSTVPLGCTRTVVLPLLEKISGLKAGEDFYLAFCPERTAEGRALEELRKLPQIVGGLDSKSTELALRLFNENTHTVIDVGSLEAAEMCKILDNTFRDTVFAYANQMAVLCETAGLNLVELVEKVNLGYSRNTIPLPSPGVGGPCLSKDPYILINDFESRGIDCPLIRSARLVNEAGPRIIVDRAMRLLKDVRKDLRSARVTIIGFAFKGEPQTSDLRDSTTLWLLDELRQSGVRDIRGYDPVVTAAEIAALGVSACSLDGAFDAVDAIFMMNNHRSYAELRLGELLSRTSKPCLFYDGWQVFRPGDVRNIPGIIYAGVGVG